MIRPPADRRSPCWGQWVSRCGGQQQGGGAARWRGTWSCLRRSRSTPAIRSACHTPSPSSGQVDKWVTVWASPYPTCSCRPARTRGLGSCCESSKKLCTTSAMGRRKEMLLSGSRGFLLRSGIRCSYIHPCSSLNIAPVALLSEWWKEDFFLNIAKGTTDPGIDCFNQ